MSKEEKGAPKEETVTLTLTQLRELGTAIAQGIAGAGPDSPTKRGETPDEWFYRQLEEQGKYVDPADRGRTPHEVTEIKCQSPETLATFTAIVSKSRTFPAGRVMRLDGYTHPPEAMKHESDGGHVPNGMPIEEKGIGGVVGVSMKYKQWRYDYYVLRDTQRYVGKDAAFLERFTDRVAAA